ncbi:MAG: AgmX/PglI C-terminal domain-containing protein, partial [Myxococcota bacterium]
EAKGQAGNKESKNKKEAQASFKAKEKPTDEQIVASKLKQLFGDSGNQGIAALFGADVSGGELQNLLGGISGAKAGESYGVGGLGRRGSGPGGGGTGVATMGIGGVGTRGRGSGDASYGSGEGGLGGKGDREPSVSIGTPVVFGSLDKEIIRRVVRENQAQIKYCYEREMTRTPGLNGKIVMKWVITGSGSVRQAQVVETTMKNKAVESCLAARINGWNFPKPKGGGIVIVTYPFLFKKSG